MPTGRKPCLEHVLPPGVGAGLTSRLPGWWPGRRGDEDGREGVAKRAEGSAEGMFSQLSLCKPKAHKGNLCLT